MLLIYIMGTRILVKYTTKLNYLNGALYYFVLFIHLSTGLKDFVHFSFPQGLQACKIRWFYSSCATIVPGYTSVLVPHSDKRLIHGYGFIVLCPPNSFRSAATIRAPNELDCKELNLASNECVMTGAGISNSRAVCAAHLPSPEC